MFIGGTVSQWVELIQYGLFMLVLFIGVCFTSIKLNNIFFGGVENNNKINKVGNINKKKIFHKVA